MVDSQALARKGIEAVKNKDYETGKRYLYDALKQEPNNVDLWLWYARTFENYEERLKYIERALKIDPSHPTARTLYEQQKARSTTAIKGSFSPPKPSVKQATSSSPAIKSKSQNLGKQVYEAKQSLSHRLALLAGWLSTGTVACFMFSYWYKLWQQWQQTFTVDVIFFGSIIALISLAPLMMLLHFILGFGEGLVIYENGLEKRGFINSFRGTWDELEKMRVYYVITTHNYIFKQTQFKLELKSYEGKTFSIGMVFDNYLGILDFLGRLTLDLWSQRDIAAISEGQTLRYGHLAINEAGISYHKKQLSWDTIINVEINGSPFPNNLTLIDNKGKKLHCLLVYTWNSHVSYPVVMAFASAARNKPKALYV